MGDLNFGDEETDVNGLLPHIDIEIQREGKGQTRAQGRDMKELGDKGNQKAENFGT
jgi:hypothetical protein